MAEKAKAPSKDWRTILSLALSILGVLYFLTQALVVGILWLVTLISGQGNFIQAIPMGLLVWSSILSGLLLVPVALFNFYHLRDRPVPQWLDTGRPKFRKIVLWIILLWPVFVFLGWLAAGQPAVAAFLLGPINVLVAGLPVLWLVNTAQWGLESGPEKRKWQIFGFSLAVTPVIIMIVELIVMLILGGIAGLILGLRISANPQLERELMHIINQVAMAGDDMDLAIKLLQPFILQPAVLFWGVAIIAGVMPIIEELIKPLALWLLAGKNLTPQQGFVGGLLCGAGFALLENVLYFTGALVAEDWLFMAISRSTTGVLHMLASGLMGLGLARAWRDGKWMFLGLMTLGSFLLHGLWNALAVVAGIAPLFVFGMEPALWQTLLFYVPLILLLLVSLGVLVGINRYLAGKKQNGAQMDETNSPSPESAHAS